MASSRSVAFAIFILSLSLLSCSHDNESEEVCDRVLYPLSATRAVTDLEPFISELTVIPLFNDSLSVNGVKKLVSVGSSLILLSGGVLYDLSLPCGDNPVIRKIGNVGRGPGEYLSINDFAVSLSGDVVFCIDVSGNILKYSLPSGEFSGGVKSGLLSGRAQGILPLSENRLALYVPNPMSSDISKGNTDFYCLHIISCEGRELSEELKWVDYNLTSAFSKPVSASDDGCYVLSPESSCPCLVYRDGEFSESVFFDFKDKNLPFRYCFSQGNEPWKSIDDVFESDYYKLTASVFLFPEAMYFSSYGKSSSLWNFYIPSDGSPGIRWMSRAKLTPPISAVGKEGGFLFFPYNDYGLVDDERDPLKKAVLRRLGKPDTTDGSVLIKVKLTTG